MDLEFFTKTSALKMIEQEIGFPNPSPRFLGWYFMKDNESYIPIVNFKTLAKEVEKMGLIAQMAEVTGLPHSNRTKEIVINKIHTVIKKHRL